MANCLKGYIGIRACLPNKPVSGLYVDDLPGISREVLEGIATPDQQNYLALWQVIEEAAELRFLSDVLAELSDKFVVRLIASVNPTFEFRTPYQEVVARPGFYQGVQLKLEQSYYTSLNMNSVQVYSGELTDVDSKLVVFDLYSGELLFEQDVVVKPRHNSFPVAWAVEPHSDRAAIFVGFESTFTTAKSTNDSCCWSCDCEYVQTRGAALDMTLDPILANVEGGGDQYGVGIDYAIRCSIRRYVCQNIDLFRRAFWLCCGVETINYWRSSQRFNNFTTIPSATMEEMYGRMKAQYTSALKSICNQLCAPECDCCFINNAQISNAWFV